MSGESYENIKNRRGMTMNEEDRDIVEFTDEDGNSLLLEVLDTFFYNGEEFAVLGDVEEDECECETCDEGTCEHEHSLYIMKIETSTDENGEEIENYWYAGYICNAQEEPLYTLVVLEETAGETHVPQAFRKIGEALVDFN